MVKGQGSGDEFFAVVWNRTQANQFTNAFGSRRRAIYYSIWLHYTTIQRQQWWSSSTNEHGIVEFYKRARVIGIVCAIVRVCYVRRTNSSEGNFWIKYSYEVTICQLKKRVRITWNEIISPPRPSVRLEWEPCVFCVSVWLNWMRIEPDGRNWTWNSW